MFFFLVYVVGQDLRATQVSFICVALKNLVLKKADDVPYIISPIQMIYAEG